MHHLFIILIHLIINSNRFFKIISLLKILLFTLNQVKSEEIAQNQQSPKTEANKK